MLCYAIGLGFYKFVFENVSLFGQFCENIKLYSFVMIEKMIQKAVVRVSMLILVSLVLASCNSEISVKVLQFNIWQEGTVIEGGFDAIADEIVRSDADFVLLSEVRNYNKTRFCDRITGALRQRGKTYYSFYSDDTGLLSRYPITDSVTVFPLNNDQGSIYKGVAKIKNREFAFYTAHLDYRNCAYYDVRGYDGSTWEAREPVTNVDSILYLNRLSMRDDAIKMFIDEAKKDVEKGRIVFLGGDMNEPSHLDWTEATKDLYDHRGAVVPWDVSVLLANAGFKDAYRELYPDPVTHPGFTFPSHNDAVKISKLTWAPDADERERIDFVYFYPDKNLIPQNAVIIGPSKSIAFSESVNDDGNDTFVAPLGVWPTDHKALLVEFKVKL